MNGAETAENDAADSLARARIERRAVGPLPPHLAPADLAAAYRIQDRVHARLAASRFGRRIGWKIACTTAVMQQYLGVPSPCAAGLFEGGRFASGAVLPAADYRRLGIECEIALRFGRDVAGDAPDEIAAAISHAIAAIELVDDRYEDWRTTDPATLVADDFFSVGCVLGDEVPIEAAGDLAALTGTTRINGAEAGRGVGADVLGHPMNALAFLAGNLAARGLRLKAGDIVLTGSLVETRWLQPGDRAEIEISGLGTVGVALSA